MHRWIALLILGGALLAGAAFVYRHVLLRSAPPGLQDWIWQVRYGYRIDRDVGITMSDGVRLANDIYFPPERGDDRLPAVLIRLPYGKRVYWEAREMGAFFASRGFVAVLQDMRGTFDSGGEYHPIRDDRRDGSDTLDWIVRQPWSNEKVGTYGCSASGETQIAMAAARHPAHAAIVALADGGAIGVMPGRLGGFGWYEGGIFNLASAFGWYLQNAALDPATKPAEGVNVDAAVWDLPTADLLKRHRDGATSFERFLTTPLADESWAMEAFVTQADRFDTPAMQITTWQDQTVADTLDISRLMRSNAIRDIVRENSHVIVSPGNHCSLREAIDHGVVGDLKVGPEARLPLNDWYLQWFDQWLNGKPSQLKLPPYLLYITGEDRWVAEQSWPPTGAIQQRWHLHSSGRANSRRGDGVLSLDPPVESAADVFTYDPAKPVPTRGGPFCCTTSPALRPGPVDQSEVEARDDVLVYTSAPLPSGVRVLGNIEAELTVVSDAPDTDLVAKLVDVDPSGLAINVQEGALRLRFREGLEAPRLMEPGTRYTVRVPMRALGHYFRPGHRIRLQVTSSSFPRLERNLNTGGRNFDESVGRVAKNSILHGPGVASALILPVVEAPTYFR